MLKLPKKAAAFSSDDVRCWSPLKYCFTRKDKAKFCEGELKFVMNTLLGLRAWFGVGCFPLTCYKTQFLPDYSGS